MQSPRKRFERFCMKNRNKGIPNLMLYLTIGSAIVYLMTMITRNPILYGFLCFDRYAILHGQIWRQFTYPLTYTAGFSVWGLFLTAISLLCYYSLGRTIERIWGTCRFNLFYLTGVVLMDIYCLIFGGQATVDSLNLSLFLSYATLFPDAGFLLFMIIPIKAWIFALFDLATVVLSLIFDPFPYKFFPLVSLLNYFLFFGKDVMNVIPMSWRVKMKGGKSASRQKPNRSGPIPFRPAQQQNGNVPPKEAPYTHKCTVCGRTDVSNPELEFRYCSKCKGYYCYCEDHINNHTHIQ